MKKFTNNFTKKWTTSHVFFKDWRIQAFKNTVLCPTMLLHVLTQAPPPSIFEEPHAPCSQHLWETLPWGGGGEISNNILMFFEVIT